MGRYPFVFRHTRVEVSYQDNGDTHTRWPKGTRVYVDMVGDNGYRFEVSGCDEETAKRISGEVESFVMGYFEGDEDDPFPHGKWIGFERFLMMWGLLDTGEEQYKARQEAESRYVKPDDFFAGMGYVEYTKLIREQMMAAVDALTDLYCVDEMDEPNLRYMRYGLRHAINEIFNQWLRIVGLPLGFDPDIMRGSGFINVDEGFEVDGYTLFKDWNDFYCLVERYCF